MNWTSVRESYGFQRPFNFTVAIPFLLNACGLALVIVACLVLLSNGNLTIGTQRFYFFLYICVALVSAAILGRISARASYALFVLCIAEVSIGVVTNIRENSGVGISYLPRNLFTEQSDPRFVYHPLLQSVPKPNVRWVWHSDSRNRADSEQWGWPVNWREIEGKDFVFQHNSLGLRGAEPSAEDMKRDLIFVYGGSTTYDIAVTQGSTWVERLQAELHGRYAILNFGVPAYSTTENLIQTTFYQGVVNKRPVCALYYEGWNDIHNAHLKGLDRAYADFHLQLTPVRSPNLYFAAYSPLVRLVNDAARRRFDSLPPQPTAVYFGGKPPTGGDKRLEEIFVEHIDTIKAINTSRGIKTVLIGQMLNKEYFKVNPEGGNAWAPRVRNEDMWPLQVRFNELLRTAATSGSPAKYIDAGVENFQVDDFTDQGHFTAAGAGKFASLVSEQVDSYCR
jgi:hypothetical protein